MLKPVLFIFLLIMFLIQVSSHAFTMQKGNANTYGPIKSKENLWNIADRIKPDKTLSTSQVAIAIFLINPEAFKFNNINGLIQGETLSIPTVEDMRLVSRTAANKLLDKHWDVWKKIDKKSELTKIPSISLSTENAIKVNFSENLDQLPSQKIISEPVKLDKKENISNNDVFEELNIQSSASHNTLFRFLIYAAVCFTLILILFLLQRKKFFYITLEHQREKFKQALNSHEGKTVLKSHKQAEKIEQETDTTTTRLNVIEKLNLISDKNKSECTLQEHTHTQTPIKNHDSEAEFIKLSKQQHIKNFIGELSDINEKLSETYTIIEMDTENNTSFSHFLMYLNLIKQLSLLFEAKYVLQYSSSLVELLQCQLNTKKSINKQLLDIMPEIINSNKEIIKALEEKRLPGIIVRELIDKADIMRYEFCPESKDKHISTMASNF